ncbi:universal stress protein [Halomarina oriensis]|uniref:Universal stress protein n=1 Tax=Halomarina oriensis TaxID=671145 RepID=A0A6B0GQK8_9EURY|nr:universal stress protein [Halomarina oriensis]MWG34953.1 universal stress protein [Halomarina oriensis]
MRTLVGIGGSDDSLRALTVALDRAAAAGDDVTVAVVENPDSELSVEAVERRVHEDLDGRGVEAEVRVLRGHPGSRLVEVADSEGFDRIVLGGGETSPLGKITIGSIAEFVLLNANTTVTLVR